MIEEKVSEDWSIEIIQSEQSEKKVKKMNRALGACGTVLKSLIFVSLSEGEEKECDAEKLLE